MNAMLRMFWMILWRFAIFAGVAAIFWNDAGVFFGPVGVVFFSALGSFLLYKVAGIEVFTHPLSRFLHKLPVYRKVSGSVSTGYTQPTRKTTPSSPNTSQPPFTIPRPIQRQATKKGRMTGYESGILSEFAIPRTSSMFGTPGAGLTGATNKFGSAAVEMGQKGEANFAKILSMTNIDGFKRDFPVEDVMIDKLYSFWSVSVPTNGKKDYDTDVDCILVKGNKMMLVDMKYYKDGDVTYYGDGEKLYTIDNATSNWVGEPKKMSRNMEMAVDRFKQVFPKYEISAIVILIPTNMGIGEMGRYPFTPMYKGNIPLYTVKDGLRVISRFFKDTKFIKRYNEDDFAYLRGLLRGSKVS